VEEEKFEDIGEIKPEEPQVPEVDLKPLPKGLKYEFLGLYKTYPVIKSDELSPEENKKLLYLLKKHRKVIGYSINDLKGLSLAFCTHRIPMEDQCKPIVDHQSVTELPKIIPYYHLSRSTWPLSNNKELFCRLCRVKPGKSLTTGLRYVLSPHEGGTRVHHYIT
jgi:hypothetical protein